MIESRSYDLIVIGAGIIGLTTATEALRRYPSMRILVLEKEAREGCHASGRNSGVMHCGIYYGRDTLKAKVCSAGAERMIAYAEERSIPVKRSGKVIVPTSEAQLPTLEKLLENASDNGIKAEKIGPDQLKELEPFAASDYPSIYCPDTAVIDSKAVLANLKDELINKGVTFLLDCQAIGPGKKSGSLQTTKGEISAAKIINAAGAYADTLAHKFGLASDYALVPFKGIYWKLADHAKHKVKANIYPVPDINMPFLGVHLTRVISGEVYVGPTAIPAFGRENYGIVEGMNLAESVTIGLRLLSMYIQNKNSFRKMAHLEMGKYRKSNFLSAARALMPSLSADDFVPTEKAGIRPQLVNLKTGNLEMDYIFEQADNSLHVLNAISPAFTGSMAFAEIICEKAGI